MSGWPTPTWIFWTGWPPYMEVGQHQESIRACYRVLEKYRCHEDSYRLLMQCYARLGLRARARRIRMCEQILGQEYGTSPSPETRSST